MYIHRQKLRWRVIYSRLAPQRDEASSTNYIVGLASMMRAIRRQFDTQSSESTEPRTFPPALLNVHSLQEQRRSSGSGRLDRAPVGGTPTVEVEQKQATSSAAAQLCCRRTLIHRVRPCCLCCCASEMSALPTVAAPCQSADAVRL